MKVIKTNTVQSDEEGFLLAPVELAAQVAFMHRDKLMCLFVRGCVLEVDQENCKPFLFPPSPPFTIMSHLGSLGLIAHFPAGAF